MPEKTTFISEKSHLCINRPSHLVQVPGPGGVPAYRQTSQAPIEFKNNKLTTANPEVIEYLRSHPGYNPDGLEGSAMFTEQGASEEAVAEAAEDDEDEDDEDEDDEDEDDDDTKGKKDTQGGTPAPPEDSFSIITGVANKAEAIRALQSTGLDVTVSTDDTKADIVAFAHEHSYRFEDYE